MANKLAITVPQLKARKYGLVRNLLANFLAGKQIYREKIRGRKKRGDAKIPVVFLFDAAFQLGGENFSTSDLGIRISDLREYEKQISVRELLNRHSEKECLTDRVRTSPPFPGFPGQSGLGLGCPRLEKKGAIVELMMSKIFFRGSHPELTFFRI